MVSVQLMGGIGNQLFQVSAGIALARNNNDNFSIDYNQPFQAMTGKAPSHYRHTLYKKIEAYSWPRSCWNIHEEQECKYTPLNYNICIPILDNPFIILKGYFQSPKYFDNCRGYIREQLYFPKRIQNKVDPILNSLTDGKRRWQVIGIHIRRGDYLTIPKILPPCSADYYRQCVEYIEYRRGTSHTKYIVCTDSPELVTKEFANEFNTGQFILANSKDELEDLYILSQCQSVIMSNSSFSWWGAYLGKRKNRIFAPKQWFGIEGPKNWDDIYIPGSIIL